MNETILIENSKGKIISCEFPLTVYTAKRSDGKVLTFSSLEEAELYLEQNKSKN